MDDPNWEHKFLLWPDSEYRKEFARSLSDYILDKDGKYATVVPEPGMLGQGEPLPPEVRSCFSDCVKQFVDELLQRHQPSQQFEPDNYAMGRFLHPHHNEDPFSALTLPRGNQIYEDALSGFSPSIDGDPRRPIRELHRQGPTPADLYPTVFDLDGLPRATHGADLAEQVEAFTEIVSSRKSHVQPLNQGGGLTPLSQLGTIGSHNPSRSGGSTLGRRQRAYSGGESTGAGSQTATRRARTKRDQPPPKTAANGVGQSSRSFGTNARSVDGSSRNTVSAGTVSKEGFKHECELCGERFEFPARLKYEPLVSLSIRVRANKKIRSHMETISHAARRYRCDQCGSVFSRKSSLKRHQDAPTACKSKIQSGSDSPPLPTSESGARDAAFRGERPPSMASPSHGNVSPSIARNQSVGSQNQYRPFGPASGPRTSFGGGGHFLQMARVSSQQQHRSLQPSVASRSSHRPSSAHSYVDPRMLQEMNGGYEDCD